MLQRHLFDYLGISRRYFYQHAEPTWKMAIRFLWGPRECFYYPFDAQLDVQHRELARPNGSTARRISRRRISPRG